MRQRDFRKELEERERDRDSRTGKNLPSIVRKAIEANNSLSSSANAGSNSGASSSKNSKLDVSANLDADDPIDNDTSDDDSNSDDEDDMDALLAELNRLKEERAQENNRKEQQKKQAEERIRMENILSGNPLINYSPGVPGKPEVDLKVKRRWNDDVVFKNCARNEPDKKKYNFINDSLRSDFHKRFMDKYIK